MQQPDWFIAEMNRCDWLQCFMYKNLSMLRDQPRNFVFYSDWLAVVEQLALIGRFCVPAGMGCHGHVCLASSHWPDSLDIQELPSLSSH